MIYADNAATTKLSGTALNAMLPLPAGSIRQSLLPVLPGPAGR